MPRRYFSYVLIALVSAIGIIFMCRHDRGHNPFHGDALGYYYYLPSAVIYHNLQDMDKFPLTDSIPANVKEYAAMMKRAGDAAGYGHAINQYTYGVALMEYPFFIGAHLYEKTTGLPAKGFSQTYIIALQISMLFFVFAGLLITYNILKRYYKPLHALIAVCIILMCTHVFWFTFRQPGMSHQPLFMLFALLMWLTIRLYERPVWKNFLLVGLLCGFITITRPTDVVCIFIPLLYNVYNRQTLQQRLQFIKKHAKYIPILIIACCLPAIPQLLYWKAVTGRYLAYSYGNQTFDFKHPRIWEGITSFGNGWLPYAPAMIFALLGLLMYKRIKVWFWSIAIILPLYLYIVYSWFTINYPNGMGARPMMHLYPLLAVPLAATVQFAMGRRWLATIYTAILVCFAAMIYSISSLKAKYLFMTEEANATYYWHVLFKDKLGYDDLVTSDIAEVQPDVAKLTRIKTLAIEDYNDSLSEHYVHDPANYNEYVYHMWNDQEYHPHGIDIIYHPTDFKDAKWIRCSGRFMVPEWPGDMQHILVFQVKDGEKIKHWKGLKVDKKIGFSDSSCIHADSMTYAHSEYWIWKEVYYYTKVPADLKEGEKIQLNIWNLSTRQIFFDDLKLELYK